MSLAVPHACLWRRLPGEPVMAGCGLGSGSAPAAGLHRAGDGERLRPQRGRVLCSASPFGSKDQTLQALLGLTLPGHRRGVRGHPPGSAASKWERRSRPQKRTAGQRLAAKCCRLWWSSNGSIKSLRNPELTLTASWLRRL